MYATIQLSAMMPGYDCCCLAAMEEAVPATRREASNREKNKVGL